MATKQPAVSATPKQDVPKSLADNHDSHIAKYDDDDYTSSSGSSEEEDESQSEDDQPVTSQQRAITVKCPRESGLRSRLAAFLPEMERSNRELEASGKSNMQRIDNVDDEEEHYVEMNLGLGVLSELGNDGEGIKLTKHEAEPRSDTDAEGDINTALVEKPKAQQKSTGKNKIQEL